MVLSGKMISFLLGWICNPAALNISICNASLLPIMAVPSHPAVPFPHNSPVLNYTDILQALPPPPV